MSLYGIDADGYCKVTGASANYDRALRGLALLRARGLDVTLLVVATEDSTPRMTEYFQVARDYHAEEFRIAPKINMGRALDGRKLMPGGEPKTWAALVAQLKAIREMREPGDPPVRINAKPLFAHYLHKLTGIPAFYENCEAGATMIYVDAKGRSMPCPFLHHASSGIQQTYSHLRSEDIRNGEFDDVWNSRSFNEFRTLFEPELNPYEVITNCKFYRDGSCRPMFADSLQLSIPRQGRTQGVGRNSTGPRQFWTASRRPDCDGNLKLR
jgi:MoaA/NifB/PqqE/SkfB family radical SAM enzyme